MIFALYKDVCMKLMKFYPKRRVSQASWYNTHINKDWVDSQSTVQNWEKTKKNDGNSKKILLLVCSS